MALSFEFQIEFPDKSLPLLQLAADARAEFLGGTRARIGAEAAEPFGDDVSTIGLLIHEVQVLYKGQLRLTDSPLKVTMWTKRLRAVDFTLGYEVRGVDADPQSKPSVIAETQLAAVHIEEQRLVRLSPAHREYLQRWLR